MAGDEWIECKLSDACSSIDYGLTASAADSELGPRFLRITDIVAGHIDWKNVPYVAADAVAVEKYRLADGDIVLARTGASTGTSSYVKNPPSAVFASYLVRLRAKPDFDSRFLSYYLKSDSFWSFIRGVLGDKSAQPNASASTMTQAPLRAPKSKDEQRAIAHILGTLDDKIELNRQTNETLEAIARAIFRSWFVDFDPVRTKAERRDPGLPRPLADLFPDSFDDSEVTKIPKGWGISSLGALFPSDVECVLTGPFGSNLHAYDYREEGIPLILVKHVVDGHILEDDLPIVGAHKLGDLRRYRLEVGDIVFTRVGAVGRSAYIHPRHSGWLFSGQTLRVRVPDWTALHPRYLAQVFLEKSFTDMVEGHALGTTRPSLNTSLLKAFRFIVPSKRVACV